MATLRTDFSSLKTTRVGEGTFGAKTTELARFKGVLEQHGLIVPPHISFPLELFRPALIRAGLLDKNGNYTGKDSAEDLFGSYMNFTKHELALFRDALAPYSDFFVAVRSDERNAKGTGVFTSQFDLASTAVGMFPYVLASQFNADANAFKRLTGSPHEIGIQVMPMVGEVFKVDDVGMLSPLLSISGLTVKGKNEVRMSVGLGLGGGVSEESSQFTAVGNGNVIGSSPKSRTLQTVDLYNSRVANVSLSDRELSGVGVNVNDCSDLDGYIRSFSSAILAAAHQAEHDFYFEAQLIDHRAGVWAMTQVAEHTWPTVSPPDGKEILRVTGDSNLLGSGVHVLGSYFSPRLGSQIPFYILARGDADPFDKTPFTQTNALVIVGGHALKSNSLAQFELQRAFVDVGVHGRPGISHAGGCFREAGKLVLYAPGYLSFLHRSLHGKKFAVWADEANEVGGITLLE